MIPAILNYVWIGPGTPTRLMQRCMEQNGAFFGGWDVQLWGEDKMRSDGISDPFFEQAIAERKWVHAAEIARWLVLEKHGGIYLDCDVEVMRPLGPLLFNSFFCGREDERTVNGAVLGAQPEHRFVREVLAAFPRDSSLSPSDLGPGHLTKMMAAHGAEDCRVYPSQFFYPGRWRDAHAGTVDWAAETRGDAYTAHYYAASWVGNKGDK